MYDLNFQNPHQHTSINPQNMQEYLTHQGSSYLLSTQTFIVFISHIIIKSVISFKIALPQNLVIETFLSKTTSHFSFKKHSYSKSHLISLSSTLT